MARIVGPLMSLLWSFLNVFRLTKPISNRNVPFVDQPYPIVKLCQHTLGLL